MGSVSGNLAIPYSRFGYPLVTESVDTPAPYEQEHRFESNRFSKPFRYYSFTYAVDGNEGLYNINKRIEPMTDDTVGRMIDLYA